MARSVGRSSHASGGMSLWSSHPKVYLPIEDKGTVKCPYCGADYVLEGE